MAILEDLHTSISEMTDEELAETMRQVRLSRRTARAKPKTSENKKKSAAPSVKTLSADMAKELLDLLEKQ